MDKFVMAQLCAPDEVLCDVFQCSAILERECKLKMSFKFSPYGVKRGKFWNSLRHHRECVKSTERLSRTRNSA